MQNTTKALAALREHWQSVGCPPIAPIAKKANVPSATANRYIAGVTKGGTPETIRALAIAMDRQDIADAIPYTSLSGNEHAEDYIAELHKQWDEAAQQRIAEEAARHKQEMELLRADHREDRKAWNEQIVVLRKQIHATTIEKWLFAALFAASMLLHHI